jgi:hypothetical protein
VSFWAPEASVGGVLSNMGKARQGRLTGEPAQPWGLQSQCTHCTYTHLCTQMCTWHPHLPRNVTMGTHMCSAGDAPPTPDTLNQIQPFCLGAMAKGTWAKRTETR